MMRKNKIRVAAGRTAAAMLLSLFIAGCQTSGSWKESTRATIGEAFDDAKGTATASGDVPADVSQALLPPLTVALPEGGTAPLEPRFNLTVNDAPARQVFMGLVEGTPYSMVVHPDVDGRITMNIKDVTVMEALDSIRHAYGYDYRRDKQRIYVLGRGMQTRLFPVNYLNFKRSGVSDTRVSSSELARATSSSTSTSSTGGTTSGGTGTGTGSSSSISVETRTEADFWSELSTTVKAMIGDKAGRQVIANPQSSLLVVRAMADELRVVEEFLLATHAIVDRQVVLEAKIIEVQLSNAFQAGVNWAALTAVDGGTVTIGQTGGGSVFGGTGLSEIAGNVGTLDPASPTAISGTDTSAFGGIFTLAAQTGNFGAFVEALKSQGDVQVLSSPRVSTVNNQKAVIKVGGDEFFVTGVSQSVVSTGIGTTSIPQVELTPFFSGIALDVTPQIDEDDNVILHIHPTVSEVLQKNKSFTIGGQAYQLPLASSSVQEADNIVRARSGQVVVLGGLMKEGTTDDNAAIPMLGDIPIAGNLFKQKKVVRIKKELVILLKPTVVKVDQTWNNMVGDYKGKVNGLLDGKR
jgi:MSHA biogenesis protein MshL